MAAVVACTGGNGSGQVDQDTLTQRQRDSLVGELPIPGASGVRGATGVTDSAKARQRMLDTIGG